MRGRSKKDDATREILFLLQKSAAVDPCESESLKSSCK